MNRKKSKGKRLLCASRMLTAIIVLSLFTAGIGIVPVSAQLTSVTRDLPVYVQPGEEFEVTLDQTGFDSGMGTVVETLPVGFEYVDGSYTGGGANKEETVTYDGGTRKLRATFAFVDEENEVLFSVTYRVTASLTEQNAVFVGEYAAWTGAGVEPGGVGGDPEVGVDGTSPETSNHVPAKGAGGVSVGTNIVVAVTDDNAVDPTTITMKIDSDAIPMILGESLFFVSMSHYTINYDPADDFDYSTVYQVTIGASDAAGNAMTPDTYIFQTEFPDTTLPAAITDLATSNPTTSTIGLAWTAPGDDGNTGTAATYDIRYLAGTTQITDATWASATQCTEEPAPQAAGLCETFTVTGLGAGTDYCFAIKTADEVPNWSPISNSPCGTTTEVPDTTPPSAISDLATSNPTSSSIDLTWTAPGDDGNTGTANEYDIRYLAGTTQITDANWDTATQCTGEPTPQVAGSSETFTVTGLAAETDYSFAIKTADEVPNLSPISNSPSGTTLVSEDTTPPYTSGHNPAKDATNVPIDTNLVVHVEDDGAGVDQATIVMTVEGETVAPVITGYAADYTLTYDPPVDFDYEQVLDVTIDASDLAATPNEMPTDAYSFTTQAAAPVYDVNLTVDDETKTTTPGVNATYTLTVENTGNVVDSYTLSVDNVTPADVAELSTDSITDLGAGETADVSLTVEDADIGTYIVNVTVTGTGVSDTVMTKTIVSLELPDLIVTEITPNCGGYIFANESNTVNATIKNNGTADAGAFNVSFSADSFSGKASVGGLPAGANTTVCVTDATERNAGESVTITVIADCDDTIAETNETNNVTVQVETVVNNGYKNKSFAGLPSLVLLEHDKFNGSIVYTVGNSSKVELYPANTTTTGFDITIPGGATVQNARLYVYWYDSWYSAVHGDADLEVTFDGHSFATPGASYTDGKGFGSYNYPKGTYAYDVTSDVSGTGTYTATIENGAPNTNTVLTGQLLLVVYEDATEPEMEYWITEGCDLLKADSNYCVSPAEAIANVTFEGTIEVANKSARLITVVAQGNEPGTDLSFNEQVWEDVWQTPEGSSKIDIDDRSVTGLRTSGNVVDFRDTGTMGMQASNAILVVKTEVKYSVNVTLESGWNMISVPKVPENASVDYILPDRVGSVWTWDGAKYVSASTLEPKKGYWVAMSESKQVNFTGTHPQNTTLYLNAGWNMVGLPVQYNVSTDVFGPNRVGSVWTWDGIKYVSVSTMEPKKGYWVAMSENAEITIGGE